MKIVQALVVMSMGRAMVFQSTLMVVKAVAEAKVTKASNFNKSLNFMRLTAASVYCSCL